MPTPAEDGQLDGRDDRRPSSAVHGPSSTTRRPVPVVRRRVYSRAWSVVGKWSDRRWLTIIVSLGAVARLAAAFYLGNQVVPTPGTAYVQIYYQDMALNLLALGGTGLAMRALFAGAVPTAPGVPEITVPWLGSIPWLGPVFFRQSPFVYGAFALALAAALFLTRTRPGLRLRAVGEMARAADAEGVSVGRTRALAVLVGAAAAGLAGSVLTLSHSNVFTEGMTAGRGFIALAALIFGNWTPFGLFSASILFAYTQALQNELLLAGITVIPRHFISMLPYVATLAVLTAFIARARPPAAVGTPYETE